MQAVLICSARWAAWTAAASSCADSGSADDGALVDAPEMASAVPVRAARHKINANLITMADHGSWTAL